VGDLKPIFGSNTFRPIFEEYAADFVFFSVFALKKSDSKIAIRRWSTLRYPNGLSYEELCWYISVSPSEKRRLKKSLKHTWFEHFILFLQGDVWIKGHAS
jgi:hypothetical protein